MTGTSTAVLLVADLFHPIDSLAAELFLDGDVAHCCGCSCAVPMLFTGRKPHDIAGANFFDRTALAPHPAPTGRDNQRLTEGVRVPGRASAGLEGHKRAGDAGGLNSGSILTVPVNQSAGPLPDGCAPLRLISMVEVLSNWMGALRPCLS